MQKKPLKRFKKKTKTKKNNNNNNNNNKTALKAARPVFYKVFCILKDR